MKELINKIDTQIADMKIDSAIGLEPISGLLIDLAKKWGEARKLAKNYKTSYELGIITKKETREKDIQKINDEKIAKGLEKGEKIERITDAELTRYAERESITDYEKYREQEAISEYLEPIIKAYDNYINAIKFDAREGVKIEKFARYDETLPGN